MRVRIIHKGLLIVMIPLAVELIILAGLAYLLHLTDIEHKSESKRHQLSHLGARLTLGNCHAGVHLIDAWKNQDENAVKKFFEEYHHLEEFLDEMSKLPQDDDELSQKLHEKCMSMENQALTYYKEIGDITKEGFHLQGWQRLLVVQRKLYKHLNATFDVLEKLGDCFDRTLQEGQLNLQRIQQNEAILVLSGFGVSIFAAFLLLNFFLNTFSFRIAQIRESIARIARNETPTSKVIGDDELAELDSAFRNMWQEIELARSREKALFNNCSDAFCTLDSNGNFTLVSAASEKIWGYDNASLAGRSILEFVNGKERELLQELLGTEEAERSEAPQKLVLSMFKFANSNLVAENIEVLWSFVWNKTERLWYCVAHDVSEQFAVQKAKEAWLAQIANDFHQPMLSISQQIAKLLSGACGKLPEKAVGKFKGIPNSISRMISIVDELIQLKDLQSSPQELDKREHFVLETLKEVQQELEPLASSRRIQIHLVLDNISQTLAWKINNEAILRVLVNLISNAVKFSKDESSITLRVSSDDNFVTISVEDQGRGIPAASLSTLFQPFEQVSTADAKRGQGTGLGLFICQNLVKAHYGEIKVQSSQGSGSTFSFTIPLDGERPDTAKDSVKEILRSPAISSSTAASSIPEIVGDASALSTPYAGGASVSSPVGNSGRLKRHSAGIKTMSGDKNRPWQNLELIHKAAILIGMPVLLETIFVTIMIFSLVHARAELELQMQERQLMTSALRLCAGLFEAATRVRNANPAEFKKGRIEEISIGLPNLIARFRQSAQEEWLRNSEAEPILKSINSKLDKLAAKYESLPSQFEESNSRGDYDLRQLSNELFRNSDLLSREIEELLGVCQKIAGISPEHQANLRTKQMIILFAALGVNIWLAIALAQYFSNDVAGRLLILAENSFRFASGKALLQPVNARDEIGQLDKAFHQSSSLLRTAREKENAFLTTATNLIAALDSDGRFSIINPATIRLLNKPSEEILNHSICEFIDANDRSKMQSALENALQTGGVQNVETQISTEHAELRDLSWSLVWSAEEENLFCTAHDISARKELERLKQRFIAVLTHDLRTPLTSVLGYIGLAMEGLYGELPASAESILVEIKTEVGRVLELVNDLLDLEKLQAEKLQLNLESVSMKTVLQRAIDQHCCQTKHDQSIFQLPNNDISVVIDKERFIQVLSTLITESCLLEPDKIQIETEAISTNQNPPAIDQLSEPSSLERHDQERSSLDHKMIELKARPKLANLSLKLTGLTEKQTEVQELRHCLQGKQVDRQRGKGSRLRLPLTLRIAAAHKCRISTEFDGAMLTISLSFEDSFEDSGNDLSRITQSSVIHSS